MKLELIQEQLSYPELVDKLINTSVKFVKRQKERLQFCRSTKSSILTKIKSTKHPTLSTRRRSFSIATLLSFNYQTIIRNVGWNEFVWWIMMPKNMTPVVSSGFTISYVVSWILACTEILRESSRTTAHFAVILAFSNTRFINPLRKQIESCFINPDYRCL